MSDTKGSEPYRKTTHHVGMGVLGQAPVVLKQSRNEKLAEAIRVVEEGEVSAPLTVEKVEETLAGEGGEEGEESGVVEVDVVEEEPSKGDLLATITISVWSNYPCTAEFDYHEEGPSWEVINRAGRELHKAFRYEKNRLAREKTPAELEEITRKGK